MLLWATVRARGAGSKDGHELADRSSEKCSAIQSAKAHHEYVRLKVTEKKRLDGQERGVCASRSRLRNA